MTRYSWPDGMLERVQLICASWQAVFGEKRVVLFVEKSVFLVEK
jgi:hypothetical protein